MGNDTAEALIHILGKDGIRQLVAAVNSDMDTLVGKQKTSKVASDAAAKSALTWRESWAVMAAGASGALNIVGQVMAGVQSLGVAIKEAVQEQSIAAQFGRSFGAAAEKMEQLREASRGMLSDASIAQIGAQAARAGLDVKQVAQLLEASTRAAIGSGQNVTEVSQAVLKSVVEQNDEAAKQLGLHVDLKKAAEDYAASIGTSVDKLTAAQRVASALKETTGAIGQGFALMTGADASSQLARLETRWNNLASVAKGFLADTAMAVVDSVTGESDQVQAAASATRNANALVDVIVRGRDTLVAIKDQFSNDIGMVGIANSIEYTRQYSSILSELQGQLDQTGQKLNAVDVVLQNLNWDPQRIEQAIHELRGLGDAAGAIKLEEAAAAAAVNRQKIQEDTEAAVALFVRWSGGISGVFQEQRDRTMDLLQARLEQGRSAERAAESTLADLVKQAELAEQLELTTQATQIWADATKLAASGQIDLTTNINALELALRGSNNEAAKAALLQAKLANALFNTAGAAEAQKRAAGLLLNDQPNDKPRGGGGGPRKPEFSGELSADTLRGQASLNQMAWDMQSAKTQANDFLQSQARADAEAASTEQLNLVLEQHQAQLTSQSEAYDAAGSAATRFGEALRDLNGVDLGALGDSVVQLGPLLDSIKALSDETGKTKSNMVNSVAGIVGASGKIAAGLIGNETAKAAVMALVETAAGVGSLAVFDYAGAGLHFASAGIYAVVAGMSAAKPSAGGGSGGRGSPSARGPTLTPSANATPPAAAPAPVSYTIYMSGATVIGSDEQQVGRQMTRILDDHRAKSAGSRSAGPR